MTARSLLLALAITVFLVVIGAVVYRRPYWRAAPILPAEVNPEAIKYAQEFAAALTTSADEPPDIDFKGGGATSPDGKLKLSTRPLRNYYHEIMISSGQSEAPESVLILQEADPGSGSSHDWRWSRDSKAVFIYGSGEPAGHAWTSELAIIYLVDRRALYSINLRPFLAKPTVHFPPAASTVAKIRGGEELLHAFTPPRGLGDGYESKPSSLHSYVRLTASIVAPLLLIIAVWFVACEWNGR